MNALPPRPTYRAMKFHVVSPMDMSFFMLNKPPQQARDNISTFYETLNSQPRTITHVARGWISTICLQEFLYKPPPSKAFSNVQLTLSCFRARFYIFPLSLHLLEYVESICDIPKFLLLVLLVQRLFPVSVLSDLYEPCFLKHQIPSLSYGQFFLFLQHNCLS